MKIDDRNIWDSDPPSQSDVVSSIQTRDNMVSRFRELWYESYLLSMREQCKDLHEIDFINHIKENDVVLVKNPAKPRPYWLLGRVLELIYGDDDKVRSAKVKRGDGSIQIHSISHLYPLELPLTHSHQPTEASPDAGSSEEITESNSNSQMSNSGDEASNFNDNQLVVSDDLTSDVDDLNLNKFSDPNPTNLASQRPRRLAAIRGRLRSHDDPYIYY